MAQVMSNITNRNPQTGIRFGIASAHRHYALLERIQQSGESITAKYWQSEVIGKIRTYLADECFETLEDLQKGVKSITEDYWYGSDVDEIAADIANDLWNGGHNFGWTEGVRDTEALVESTWGLLEAAEIWDRFNPDEETHELIIEIDGEIEEHYQTSWMGGAPMIWILKSPETALCRLCSPCAPNAGNLDEPDEDGVTAYAIPQEWRNADR